MAKTRRTPVGVERGWTATRRWSVRDGAGGLLPILAALALWAWVLAGVLAPLGDALVRIDAGRQPAPAPAACPVPPGALAAAPGEPAAGTCR